MKWYLKVLKQYADFSGRARRKEFWMFILFHIIFLTVANILDRALGTTFNLFEGDHGFRGWIYLIYGMALFVPGLAVTIRRLHDIGKSGWKLLIGLIPLVGAIIILIWNCKNSQAGENKWGLNPKE
jgi:uncharacterized membrane protein YhaH (DUF805 family)